jgi:hypothetical protein
MNPENDLSSSEAGRGHASKRPWLVLGGLTALFFAAMLCLVAVAGVGGLLWLRTAQPAIVAPAPAAPARDLATDAPEAAPPLALPATAGKEVVNRIAFVDPAGRLGTVAPDGSDSRLLTTTGATYQFPAWAPDGSQIAAVGIDGNEGGVYLWADEANARRSDLFTSSMRPPIYLYWSPDSRQVSFLANDRASLGCGWRRPTGLRRPARSPAASPFIGTGARAATSSFVHSGGTGAQCSSGLPRSRQRADRGQRGQPRAVPGAGCLTRWPLSGLWAGGRGELPGDH